MFHAARWRSTVLAALIVAGIACSADTPAPQGPTPYAGVLSTSLSSPKLSADTVATGPGRVTRAARPRRRRRRAVGARAVGDRVVYSTYPNRNSYRVCITLPQEPSVRACTSSSPSSRGRRTYRTLWPCRCPASHARSSRMASCGFRLPSQIHQDVNTGTQSEPQSGMWRPNMKKGR